MNTELPGMLSRQNPQFHLQPVSVTGSSYDITDFVDSLNETDKVVSSNDEFQLICRSGPRKPKLEKLAVNHWLVAFRWGTVVGQLSTQHLWSLSMLS